MESTDLSILEKLKVFTVDELRYISSKRDEYDKYLVCYNPGNVNVCKALEFETKFLEDIIVRFKRIKKNEQPDFEIELAIVKRMIHFNSYLNRGNLKTSKYETNISSILSNIIESYPERDDVWVLSATWHAEQYSIDNGLQILYEGICKNYKSKSVYFTLFELEYRNALKNNLRNDETFKRIKDLYICILKNVGDAKTIEFLFTLIKLTDDQEELQKWLIDITKEKFDKVEEFWDSLALQELNLSGDSYCDNSEISEKDNELKDNVAKCIETYATGVRVLPTVKMWHMFLNTLLLSNQFNNKIRMKYLTEAYELSKKPNANYAFLDEMHFVKLATLMITRAEKEEVLRFSTRKLSQSSKLWCEYLMLFINDDDLVRIEDVFEQGRIALGDKALPLWELKLKYIKMKYMCNVDELLEHMREVYLKGIINQPDPIKEALQVSYLKWLMTTKGGLSAARKGYLSMPLSAISFKCHNTMLEFELSHQNPNEEIVEQIFTILCEVYGHEDVDCWLKYAHFLMLRNNSRVQQLVEDAMKCLNEEKRAIFNFRFELMKFKADEAIEEINEIEDDEILIDPFNE